RNTVDFSPNFDGTLLEPDVLPAAVPNLLLNGASGIAVGMATNIPPHNLVELVNAMVHMIERWDKLDDVSTSDLMKYVKGPDFPTGGIVLMDDEKSDLDSIYSTGRGRFTVRGVVHLEEMSRGRNRILVTELPYTVNKASLIERMAELAREGKMDGISDIRDESDRNGMRIIIELSKTADPEKILADLYHKTALQTTFGMTILALDKGEPRLLSLKRALKIYLDHRIEVVSRRSKHDLEKAKQREHILAGLRIAVNNIDEIIAIIRKAADVETARTKLMQKFKLSEIQANAILDMQLRRLAALERKKIEDEYKEITALIKELEALLKSPKKIRQLVETELEQIREKYGDRRRTQIFSAANGEAIKAMLTMTDMMPVQRVWLGMTDEGMLARSTTEKLPKVTGKQAPCRLIKTDTHHLVYVVTKDGKAFSVRASALPETDNFQEGALISKFSSIQECDSAAAVFTVPAGENKMDGCFVITASRLGMIKKSSINDLPGPSSSEFVMSRVNDQDNLIEVLVTDGQSDICLITARGMLIRFPEKEIRSMGLIAAGVNGIKLAGDDVLVGAFALKNEGELLLVSNNGLGWRFNADSIPVQGRYGQGVIACKLKDDEEIVGFLFGKSSHQGLVHFQKGAAKAVKVDLVPVSRRNVRGKPAFTLKEGDEVYQLTPIIDEINFWEKCAKPG
ncbi:MAG: DNA gyrase subunit A, partial [Anaerolineaceae bacterium]